jgi:hypothetical protein
VFVFGESVRTGAGPARCAGRSLDRESGGPHPLSPAAGAAGGRKRPGDAPAGPRERPVKAAGYR